MYTMLYHRVLSLVFYFNLYHIILFYIYYITISLDISMMGRFMYALFGVLSCMVLYSGVNVMAVSDTTNICDDPDVLDARLNKQSIDYGGTYTIYGIAETTLSSESNAMNPFSQCK